MSFKRYLAVLFACALVGFFIPYFLNSGGSAGHVKIIMEWAGIGLMILTFLLSGVAFVAGRCELYLTRRRAEAGDAEAQNNLGAFYQDGKYGLARDYATAVEWYGKAADQDNLIALANLGVCSLNGFGMPMDDAKAADYFQLAADGGHGMAQYKLGLLFREGIGVPQNLELAREWFQHAVTNGCEEARDAMDYAEEYDCPSGRAEG